MDPEEDNYQAPESDQKQQVSPSDKDDQFVSTDAKPSDTDKAWLNYAIFACICFTISNVFASKLSQVAGYKCIYYYASGNILAGSIYHLFKSRQTQNSGGHFWNDQNIIVDGKMNIHNLKCLLANIVMIMFIEIEILLNIYYAN